MAQGRPGERRGRVDAELRPEDGPQRPIGQREAPPRLLPEARVPGPAVRRPGGAGRVGAADHRHPDTAGRAAAQCADGVVDYGGSPAPGVETEFGLQEGEVLRPICSSHGEGAAGESLRRDAGCLERHTDGRGHIVQRGALTDAGVGDIAAAAPTPADDPAGCFGDQGDRLAVACVHAEEVVHGPEAQARRRSGRWLRCAAANSS